MIDRKEAIDLIARLHVQCMLYAGNGDFHGGITDRILKLRETFSLTSKESGDEIIARAMQVRDKLILMLHNPELFVH